MAGLLLISSTILVGLLSLFASIVYKLFFSALASIPGPFWARLTDLWYAHRIYRGDFEQVNLRLHAKHGPIVRYGPNRFSLNSSAAAKLIYGHGTELVKSAWYESWSHPSPGQWNLFGDRNRERHAQTRRQYQNTYSMSALVNYEYYVDQCADIFCQRLSEMSQTTTPDGTVDMGHWFQCYAFDVIGMITYSKRLGFVDYGEDVGNVMKNLGDHLAYASLIGVFPSFHPALFKLRNWLAGKNGQGRQFIINFTKEWMAAHQAEPKSLALLDDGESATNTLDFLSKFLQKHAEEPAKFSTYHVLAGCVSNMVAGSDTTSISLSAVLYYLLRHPSAMRQLREEVDCHYESTTASNITFRESQAMPYLQAVIKEALRLHPATGLPLERVVPEGGITIEGQFFPKGAIVGINSWVEHRSKGIFGEDADEFNPDRWLASDKERLSQMNRHWMPFGLGSRTCIGRHISMLEMCKLVPRLLHEFDFQLARTGSWKTTNFWFVKPEEFYVRVQLREYRG